MRKKNLGDVYVLIERPSRGTVMFFATVVVQARHLHSLATQTPKSIDSFFFYSLYIHNIFKTTLPLFRFVPDITDNARGYYLVRHYCSFYF